jgi:hypothetical protein
MAIGYIDVNRWNDQTNHKAIAWHALLRRLYQPDAEPVGSRCSSQNDTQPANLRFRVRNSKQVQYLLLLEWRKHRLGDFRNWLIRAA